MVIFDVPLHFSKLQAVVPWLICINGTLKGLLSCYLFQCFLCFSAQGVTSFRMAREQPSKRSTNRTDSPTKSKEICASASGVYNGNTRLKSQMMNMKFF